MATVNGKLREFATAQENARKFQRAKIGDVDPAKCFADFMLTVHKACQNPDSTTRLEKVYGSVRKTAMAETVGGITGGYTVPLELRDDLMHDISDLSLFRKKAIVVPMQSESLQLPMPDAVTVPAALGTAPFWGGLLAKFQKEGQLLQESEPAFKQLELVAWWLGGQALESEQMFQDGGVGLEQWLRQMFTRSLAWYEDWYFLNGNGVGQPLGVINSPAAIKVSRGTSGHFKIADAQTMWSDFYTIDDGCWMMAKAAGADLTGFTGWIPNGPMILYGHDIYSTMKNPALGNVGDVVLTDRSMYVIGDRQQLFIDVSHDSPVAWTKFQNVWRFSERVDGQPLLSGVITIPDGADTTVSPYVILN